MIEWFWLMLFVGVSYFEGIQLFINRYWVLLFSFHFIDETGWFKELMKRREKIWKVIWLFFIPLTSVLFGVFDEMVVSIIVWVFPTDSHELEHTRDHMCRSDVKPSTPCVCGMKWGACEGSGMIIHHQSHSQHNTDPKYPVCQSECGDFFKLSFDDVFDERWEWMKKSHLLKRAN